ncbi:MAG: trigger factor [Planctomycetota bacterium]|nr:trigger factor [Planctomycetota bacterium]
MSLKVVGSPGIEEAGEYEEGEPYRFEVEVEVEPEFAAPEFKGLKLQKLRSEVTDEDIEQELKSLQFRSGTWEKREGREAQEKDAVIADIDVMREGETVTTLEGHPLHRSPFRSSELQAGRHSSPFRGQEVRRRGGNHSEDDGRVRRDSRGLGRNSPVQAQRGARTCAARN